MDRGNPKTDRDEKRKCEEKKHDKSREKKKGRLKTLKGVI